MSVLYALAPEETAASLTASHEEAVRAALAYLEEAAVAVRRGHGGERVEAAEGLIAAAYRHRMSRALDPQLHTHVVAANLAPARTAASLRCTRRCCTGRRRRRGICTRRICGRW